MTVPIALTALSLVIAAGLYISRRAQSGYIDYLTPLLAMYVIHTVTRGATVFYVPEWLYLNAQVANASERAIAEALLLTALALCALIVAYLVAFRLARPRDLPTREVIPISLQLAVGFIAVGLLCRGLLRLAAEEELTIPAWAATPIETFGWAALAGVYTAAFSCGRSPAGKRARAAWMVGVATLAILAIDARISVSREATLQPILAALLGLTMGAGIPVSRIAVLAVSVGLPLFVWIGAMKVYSGLDLGDAHARYLEALPVVREHSQLGWPQWLVNLTQERFHGLDSLIVTRAIVPRDRPYEPGSIWSKVLVSAFVPRAFYPEKQVGWGDRFATEFWGVAPQAEGQSAAVGISHLGTFYIYGGVVTCVSGMAILGGGLGFLAAYLRRRRNVFGPTLFVLTALTICQVDRDLEVVLGGVLKQFAAFAVLMPFRPLMKTSTPRRAHAATAGPLAVLRPQLSPRSR